MLREPERTGVSTGYGFEGHNLAAYRALLPGATLMEKLGFQQLIAETLTIDRQKRSILSVYPGDDSGLLLVLSHRHRGRTW